VYLPVNLNQHWSLCVLMDPSKAREFAIANVKDDSFEIHLMLHVDSLHYHNSSVVGNNVRRFLNISWKQSHIGDFFLANQIIQLFVL
jgi:Ulp1 family protease